MGKTIPLSEVTAWNGDPSHTDRAFLSSLALTGLSWLFRKNAGEHCLALGSFLQTPRESACPSPGLAFLGVPRGGPPVLMYSPAQQPSRRGVCMLLGKAGAPGRREGMGKDQQETRLHPGLVLTPCGALSKSLPSRAVFPVSREGAG